jgi:arabinose-5-phosphate isomerase
MDCSECFLVGRRSILSISRDSDIRPLLRSDAQAPDHGISQALNRSPRTVRPDRLVTEALQLMEQSPPCGELPGLDDDHRPIGVLNLKDVARAGIF